MDVSSLAAVGGLVLVTAALIANAYWQDAVRWDAIKYGALRVGNSQVEKAASRNVSKAKLLFRFSTFVGFLVTLGVGIIVLAPETILWSKWLIIVPVFFIVAAFLYFTVTRNYFVPIETSDLLVKLEPPSRSRGD